jgi:site-specific DNA recombinase
MAKQQVAALYARFSSEKQKVRSIDDQFVVCRTYAKRENIKALAEYSDEAKSGSSMFERDGLRNLMVAARKKEFDILIVEATDRLSRNQADLASLFEHLKYHGVKLMTVAQGEVTEMQIAFDGISNPDYIRKLIQRVKRGQDGIARDGKIPGDKCYGYDLVPFKPGERTINNDQATIVVRIFREYANGMTPRQIVAGLERDGIPSPSGGMVWNYQGIVGGLHKRGLIHNSLYVGELVRNRFQNVLNPETGKRVTRKGDDSDLITIKVPHLRIVDQNLWNAAHKIRTGRAVQKFGKGGYVQRAVIARTPSLLAGLVKCGACSGLMSVTASSRIGQRIGCSEATYRRTCAHTKTYDLGKITNEVVAEMVAKLSNPDFLHENIKAKAVRLAQGRKEESSERQAAEKKLDRLNTQIANLVRALDSEDNLPAELIASLKAKEVERAGLKERVRQLAAEGNVIALHPTAIQAFRKSIETLHAKLKRDANHPECRMALANLIDGVIVHPTPKGEQYDLSLWVRETAIRHGFNHSPAQRSIKEIIAAEGLPRVSVEAGALKRSH